MSFNAPQINAHVPKINQESIVYMCTLLAFCFSFSVWSNANTCLQLILGLASVATGLSAIKNAKN